MLSRRHLRIKVLQTLYVYASHQPDMNIDLAKKQLIGSIKAIEELYFLIFRVVVDLLKYIDIIYANKILGKHPINKLSDNPIISSILNNETLFKKINSNKYNLLVSEEFLNSLYKTAKKKEKFTEFIDSVKNSESQELLLYFIINKVLRKSDLFNHEVDNLYINWQSDKSVVLNYVIKKLKSVNEIEISSQNWKEELDFADKLLTDTILNENEYQQIIAAKTKNWDGDRIALVDNLLMKLALSELIHFPTIPVKVTIDEYIEISKEYSTPKSKIFINGVLDKLLIDLQTTGKISKTGRGLKT